MRSFVRILCTLASVLFIYSCKGKAAAEAVAGGSASENITALRGDTTDIHISFYSIAYGIDMETLQGVDGILKPLEAEGQIRVDRRAWGREGEVDLCIFRKNANEMLMEELLKQLRVAVVGGKNLRLSQGTVCRSKN
jgi:hypothetical protein